MIDKNNFDISKGHMKFLAEALGDIIPVELRFALLVFPTEQNNSLGNYISNAHRDDMIQALRNMADQLETRKYKVEY